VVLIVLAAAETPVPALPGPSEQSRREFCSILTQCGLPAPAPLCTAALGSGVADVVYDEARCAEPRRLHARGVRPEGELGYRLYRFLGRRYRVVYPIEGRLDLSPGRMERLLADLPFAARLLSHLQKVDYQADYLDPDHVRFRGRRGGGLSGEADRAAGGPSERSLVYFGRGRSQVGPWSMQGQGLVFVDYAPAPGGRGLQYHLQVVATPTNAFYNFLMNRGLFKSVLVSKVREILDDIGEASRKLDEQSATIVTAPHWTADDREKLTALLRVP
jgi:hypothetical protein